MTFKEQLVKIKENWLLILLAVLLVFLFLGGSGGITEKFSSYAPSYVSEQPAASFAQRAEKMYAAPGYRESFAPEVKDRLVAKTASQSTEVELGHFADAESRLKSIVKSSESYLLSENVNTYNSGEKGEYTTGSYEIKVESSKYDAVVQQLKGIGKLLSFRENAEDVTGVHSDLKAEVESEKTRLGRYQEMYNEAKKMEDKITLSDRMFDLEKRIKYLEESVDRIEKQVTYSTIYVSITEKRSDYTDIVFVELSTIAAAFVGSLNALLVLAVALLPWALALVIIIWLIRKLRQQPSKKK